MLDVCVCVCAMMTGLRVCSINFTRTIEIRDGKNTSRMVLCDHLVEFGVGGY